MSPSSKAGKRWCSSQASKVFGVHGVVVGLGCDDASQAQAEDEGDCFVMPMRNTAAQTLAAPASAVAARHVGRRRRLVDEHQFQRIEVETDPRTLAVAAQGRPGGSARSHARTFFERDVVVVEKAPDHRRRHLLTSPKLQTVPDFVERKVRLAPMKAKKKIRVRLEAL